MGTGIEPQHVLADADHQAVIHPADEVDGIPTDCGICNLAIHTDRWTGILRHGFDD